jgi:spore maturation protein CgeB
LKRPLDIVILGLSVTSSWGNGHATTYRSLIRGLAARGHRVLFLERDAPWYAANRDESNPDGAVTELYESFEDLPRRFEPAVSRAHMVIVGSFVPDGIRVGEWVTSVARGITAFYDIDTPVTLASLAAGNCDYLTRALLPRYRIYLSFTGGPTLRFIETGLGAAMVRPLYCSVDPEQYRPRRRPYHWELGYLGTYSKDRQPLLEDLMLEPARRLKASRFAVVGPMYPRSIVWPANVDREMHLSPRQHMPFYASQRFTLNLTRTPMKQAGYSPSVRLFEAGACATPIISDWWEGLDSLLRVDKEVFVASNAEDTLRFLRDVPDDVRLAAGYAARRRILAEHTPASRATQLEEYWKECHDNASPDTSCRNGRHREVSQRLDPGLASECAGEGAGRVPG